VKLLDSRAVESSAALPASVHESSPGTTNRRLPELVHNPPPTYPLAAFFARIEGTVTLRLFIGPDGHVGKVEIATSSGYPVLDAEAVRAVRGWQFLPATRSGRPISMTVRLPVRFELDRAEGPSVSQM
jgi:protein TonB